MTILIGWVAYGTIATLFNVYLCQDPEYVADTTGPGGCGRATLAFLWPIMLPAVCCGAFNARRDIENAIARREAAAAERTKQRDAAAAIALDADIAEVLQLIEYDKYCVDPFTHSQPRGSEQCR